MIKKALEYIVGLKEPFVDVINGKCYSDKPLERVETEDYARSIELTTLSSLVEYIKAGVEDMKGTMIVHVESPTRVKLFSVLDEYRNREYVAEVNANLPVFYTDRYLDTEMFIIALQSKFVDNADKALLMQFAGTVEDGTVQQYGDDGVTQKAVIKTGISSKSEAVVPNPVRLKPYRTFTEVEQPESAFIFRMKSEKGSGVTCAIFEADGGAWKREAMENIKAYLKEALDGLDGYLVIS